jgi:hypothetical protein
MGGKRRMVTNNYDFKTVTRLRMLCMKVLPTVYGDALSYEEQVCKVTEKINQLVDTVNALPDYIVDVVKELIEAEGLEDIIKNVLADLYFINVKNPPNNMSAAVGDGVTDDTAAIQAMIAYLSSKRAYLFFPAGIYSVTGLNVTTNMSLVGFDRYQTTLQLRAGSNKDLLTGDLGACTINDITLDANMPGQTQNCSVFDGNVGNMLVSNVIFKNGYDVLDIDVDGLVQMDNIVFDGVQGNGLTIGGERCTISNVDFINTSELNNNALLTINSNYAVVDKITCFTPIKNGINVSGNYCRIDGIIQNAITPITNTGVGNVINVSTANGNIAIKPQTSENYSGGLTVNAPSSTELIAGDKTVNVGGNLTESVTGDIDITAENITQQTTGKIDFESNDIVLNPNNPLTYKAPKVGKPFSSIPFKDSDGNNYDVLVGNGSYNFAEKSEIPIDYYLYCKAPFASAGEGYRSQGFTMIENNALFAYSNDITHDTFLQLVNPSTGAIINTSSGTYYHANSLTFNASTNEILIANYYADNGYSKTITVLNSNDLSLKTTRTYNNVSNGIMSVCADNDTVYLADLGALTSIYTVNDTSATLLVTLPISTKQNIYIHNDIIYAIGNYGTLWMFDMNGKLLNKFGLDRFSKDGCAYNAEMQDMSALADGTICLSNLRYTYSNMGRVEGSVILTLNKAVVTSECSVFKLPATRSRSVYMDSTYRPYSNGTAKYPFDCIQETIQLATQTSGGTANLVLNAGGNADFEEAVNTEMGLSISLTNINLLGLFIRGEVLLNNSKVTMSDAMTKLLDTVNFPSAVTVVERNGFFNLNSGTIDCDNTAAYGCYTDTNGRIQGSSDRIINNTNAKIYNHRSFPVNYGTSTSVDELPYVPTNYRRNKNEITTGYIGGHCGMISKSNSGPFTGTIAITFEGNYSGFVNNMVSITLSGNTYTFDTANGNSFVACVTSQSTVAVKFIKFTLNVALTGGNIVATFSNIGGCQYTNNAWALYDGTNTLDKVAIW